jgi:hypothetical protein
MSKTSQDLHTVNNFIENSFVKAASKGNTRAMLTSDYLSWESAAPVWPHLALHLVSSCSQR